MNVEIVLRVPAITLTHRFPFDIIYRSLYLPLTMVYRINAESRIYWE